MRAVSQIDAIPKILEVICRTTGLGFSAVARVTEDRWIACAVRDETGFGLEPGGELRVETTICNEIRQTGRLVAIDHVSEDPLLAKALQQAGVAEFFGMGAVVPDGKEAVAFAAGELRKAFAAAAKRTSEMRPQQGY